MRLIGRSVVCGAAALMIGMIPAEAVDIEGDKRVAADRVCKRVMNYYESHHIKNCLTEAINVIVDRKSEKLMGWGFRFKLIISHAPGQQYAVPGYAGVMVEENCEANPCDSMSCYKIVELSYEQAEVIAN